MKWQLAAPCLLFSLGITCSCLAGSDQQSGSTLPEAVAEQLLQAQVISGYFEQRKEQQGLPQPLQSSGEFLYWRDRGIYWATQLPLAQTTLYRSDATLSLEGDEVRELGGRAQRAFRRVLLDLFSFDQEKLEQQFDLQWRPLGEQDWELVLLPRSHGLKRSLREVSLVGSRLINSLRIIDARGQALHITFSRQVSDTRPLDQERCQSLFMFSAQQCQAQHSS